MMSLYADLHLHTNFSDGSDAPAVVVARAAELGFSALAITDHDTVSGLAEGGAAASEHGIEFLCGTEISAIFARREVHVISLGIDPENVPLVEALRNLREERVARADAIILRLNALGVAVEGAQVRARAGRGAVGRLHIARELHAQGVTKTVQRAFDKYIGEGRQAFVPKVCLPCREAVDLIHGAGGLAFVAHPGVGGNVHRKLPDLLKLPFDGIEVYHTRHTPGQVTRFRKLADEQGLLISGGSDCHGGGDAGPLDIGKVRVPYVQVERILGALGRH